MKFNYSICYPNESDIDFYDVVLNRSQVHSLVKNYPWNQYLGIEVEYYNIGIDIINIYDRNRIIFNADGSTQNIRFQIMYILPNSIILESVFDQRNYYKSQSYTLQDASLSEAIDILELFTSGYYEQFLSRFAKDECQSDFNPRSVDEEIGHKSRVGLDMPNTYTKLYVDPITNFVVRFVGLVILPVFFLFMGASGMYPFYLVAFFFFVGSLIYEIRLYRKK